MKFYPRFGLYKGSNVTFNPTTLEAFSYSWWKFVGVVEGKLIFNNYRYSNTTGRHQMKVRSQMTELGIKPDIVMPLPAGINGDNLEALILAAEEHLCNQFLSEIIKRQERYARQKQRKAARDTTTLDAPMPLTIDRGGV